jgi:Holliday junction resolvase-like predicted endonuclease
MITDLEIKLLELTKTYKRTTLRDLALGLRVDDKSIRKKLASLRDAGFVNWKDGIVEQDSVQRMMLAQKLIQQGRDPQRVSRLLVWQEFEQFVERALMGNGYRAVRHFVFKSSLGRREIDILAWNDVWILAIDCKHWATRLAYSRIGNSAHAQMERTCALARRADLLQRCGIKSMDLPLTAVILVLGEPRDRVIDGVPIVPLEKFPSFLREGSPYEPDFTVTRVSQESEQATLLSSISTLKNRSHNLTQDAERRH